MELDRKVRLLRALCALVVLVALLSAGASAWYAWSREPVYEAEVQFFVSARVDPEQATPSELYQGQLFAQSRVVSYARIVSGPPVAGAIVENTNVARTAEQVQSAISAGAEVDTVLVEAAVEDRSPVVAKQIADGLSREFPRFVAGLEASGGEESPVNVSVTAPPRLPTSPASPPRELYVVAGLLAGLMLGGVIALTWWRIRARVRS